MNRNFSANKDGMRTCCIVCGKPILDGNWFARFPLGDEWVTVCRPYCLEKFLDDKADSAAKLGLSYSASVPALP
jgi:hypothetical protein